MPHGIGQWIIILIVVLLLFGSTKLPALARSIGQSMKAFRNEVKDIQPEDTPAPPAQNPAQPQSSAQPPLNPAQPTSGAGSAPEGTRGPGSTPGGAPTADQR